MILGLFQCPSPQGDLDAGFAALEAALATAAAGSADMLVMPEAFLPGYGAARPAPPPGWERVEARIAAMCRHHATALTVGLPEHGAGHIHNAALAFDDRGEVLARYRKIQLFGPAEAALYAPGDAYVTFDYRGTRFGLLICYDVEFPEHVRALARRGAEVILVPTANMEPFVNVTRFLVPSRAAENAVSIVYANYCGTEGALSYTGRSAIYGPDGDPLAAMGTGPGVCLAELPSGSGPNGIPLSSQLSDLRGAT